MLSTTTYIPDCATYHTDLVVTLGTDDVSLLLLLGLLDEEPRALCLLLCDLLVLDGLCMRVSIES